MKRLLGNIIISILLFSGLAFSNQLILKGPSEPSEFKRVQPWTPMVSDRNILDLERESMLAFPKLTRSGIVDTVRVCAIRIEFEPDSTPRTTGDGTFDYRPREEAPHPFDPPPHNRSYFQSHMEALQRYYLAVSDSQVFIEYSVYPDGEELAYRLPDSMGYYGELGWMGSSMADRMQQFSKDSWELALSYSEFDAWAYDAFIIFHAGSDWQNDVASQYPEYVAWWPDIFVPSPDDLPTGYLKLPFTIGGVIEDCIIMPEHAWQDGQYVCINGALVHEFGHQLGLVDLYNTGNFITEIGNFSLMDNGFGVGAQICEITDEGDTLCYNVYGAFPGYPDAWSRAYLGWETPLVVESDTSDIVLQACELPMNDGTTLIKIPINSYEFFLIENRQDYFDYNKLDSLGYPTDFDFAYLKQDPTTGVIIGASTGAPGDTLFTTSYDYLLPGHGALVWHIDETAAYDDVIGNGVNNFNDNTLQWDRYRKFVCLEEADGFQDLGFIVTYGEPQDYWGYPNKSQFSPWSNPSTETNSGGATGIEVTFSGVNFSPEIRVAVNFDEGAPSATVKTVVYPMYAPLNSADLDGDGIDEIYTEGYTYESGYYYGCVLIWDAYGEPFIDNGYTVQGGEFDGNVITVPYPVAATVNAGRVTLPAVGDINGDSLPEVVAIDTDGRLHAWNPRSTTPSGKMTPVPGFPVMAVDSASRSVSLWDIDGDGAMEIIAYGAEEWTIYNGSGAKIGGADARGDITGVAPYDDGIYVLAKRQASILYDYDWFSNIKRQAMLDADDISYISRADLDNDGVPREIIAVARSGKIFALDSTLTKIGDFPAEVNDTSLASPVVADLDGDGAMEILISGRGGLHSYRNTGFPSENAPFECTDILAPPVFTGEIAILPSSSGNVIGVDSRGGSPSSFPLNGGPSNATPCLFRDPDGKVGMALGSTNGSIFFWHGIADSMGTDAWPMWGADAQHTFLQKAPGSNPALSGDLVIESFYNYPNPANRFTNFRYEVSSPESEIEIKIDIFDITGNHIASLENIAQSGSPHETEWAVSNVGSGVYWAKLTVESGGKSASEMFRVAVAK